MIIIVKLINRIILKLAGNIPEKWNLEFTF